MATSSSIDAKLAPNVILRGPVFPEPVQVITATRSGTSFKLVARGTTSNQTYQLILSAAQLALVTATSEHEPFDGDAARFRLGVVTWSPE